MMVYFKMPYIENKSLFYRVLNSLKKGEWADFVAAHENGNFASVNDVGHSCGYITFEVKYICFQRKTVYIENIQFVN